MKMHAIMHHKHKLQWLLVLGLVLGFIAFFYFDGYHYFDIAVWQAHSEQLQTLVTTHFWLTWWAYGILFFVAAFFCLPTLLFMMLIGGFLFGIAPSFIAIVVAEFFAAMAIFFIVRTTFGSELNRFVPAWLLKKLEQENKVLVASYLVFLRMLPLAPFGAINVGAGLLRLSPRLFALTTFFGIMPEAILYSMIGTDLERLLQQEQASMQSIMMTPTIFWPLCIAAGLALTPVIYVHVHQILNRTKHKSRH